MKPHSSTKAEAGKIESTPARGRVRGEKRGGGKKSPLRKVHPSGRQDGKTDWKGKSNEERKTNRN